MQNLFNKAYKNVFTFEPIDFRFFFHVVSANGSFPFDSERTLVSFVDSFPILDFLEVETSISGTALCLSWCLLWFVDVASSKADLLFLSATILSPLNWIDDSRWERGKHWEIN